MRSEEEQEERIEKILEIEHELAEQVEASRRPDPEPDEPDNDEGPADSRLDERTGRIIDLERKQSDGGNMLDLSHPSERVNALLIRYLTHEGETESHIIDWPDDPTDDSEELVRLCQYLDVPIERIADLQGEYVPLEQDRHYIDIPPIQTRGNRLLYWLNRRFGVSTEDVWTIVALTIWIPFLGLGPIIHSQGASAGGLFGTVVRGVGNGLIVLGTCSLLLLGVVLAGGLAIYLYRHILNTRNTYFPKS